MYFRATSRLPLFSLFDELGISGATIVVWISRFVGLLIVWAIVWVLVRYLSRWITRLDDHVKTFQISPRDPKILDRMLDYATLLIGLIINLAILGWTSLLYSVLTAAGLFSVMIGFAVKDVTANFISGIFILIDQPFAPGDFIEVSSHSGTVESISLRTTILITPDGPVVHIPNSVLAVQPTVNYSIAQARCIKFSVSIAHDANANQALKTIKGVLASTEGLLAEQTQLVLVDDLREYAVDIGITCYAPSDTWLALSSDLKQGVMAALQGAGIELAVPIRKNVNLDLPAAQTQPFDG